MKKISIYLSLILLSVQGFSQNDTLLTINNKPITEGEFLRIYQKNNTNGHTIDKKSVEEYLDLFINFKLKVAEAEARGMDTLPKFKQELQGYQKQLEKPYFTDKNTDERLVREAFERMQYDVRAAHILVMIAKNASPTDTLLAYNKIKAIRREIVEGKKDFQTVAKQKSEDPSAKQNGGDLGYFTAFQMVYSFENAAYNTKVGEVSEIVRSRYGYHILKVLDKRKSKGEIQVAHIMVALPKNADEIKSKAAEDKINMIYGKLENGEDFKELAQLYSDDKGSAKKGGVLQWISTGKMPPAFDKAAFALQQKGDYSKPVKTIYGWHIIKLVGKKELPKYEESEKMIRERVNSDMRARTSKVAVYNRLKKYYKYSLNTKSLNDFYRVVDKGIFVGNWDKSKAKNLHKTLFTLNDSAYSQQVFVEYLAEQSNRKRKEEPIRIFVDKMYKQYIEKELENVEREHLSEKYPEYRYLLQEYYDGILLFDLTDQEVWTKAISDTSGLNAFYKKNKANYIWEQRVEAKVYSVADTKTLPKLKKILLKQQAKRYSDDNILQILNKKNPSAVELVNKNTYTKGDYTIMDKANETLHFFDKEDLEVPLFLEMDTKLIYVTKIIPRTQKLLSEAKGQITADYQDYLETQWVKELRQKYPVVINKTVWNKIKNQH